MAVKTTGADLLHAIERRGLPHEVQCESEGGIHRSPATSSQLQSDLFRRQDLDYVTGAYPRLSATVAGITQAQFITVMYIERLVSQV